jgi:cytosine/uracil/thiamine/allantoin permease
MRRTLIALAALALLIPTIGVLAQEPTETPTPTPTSTPTFTPSATANIWYEATVGVNQYVQLEYSITAGQAFISTGLLVGIGLLLMLVFLALVERRR